jgi:hypothetical protein
MTRSINISWLSAIMNAHLLTLSMELSIHRQNTLMYAITSVNICMSSVSSSISRYQHRPILPISSQCTIKIEVQEVYRGYKIMVDLESYGIGYIQTDLHFIVYVDYTWHSLPIYHSQLGGGFQSGTGRGFTWTLFRLRWYRLVEIVLASEHSKRGKCCMSIWIMSLCIVRCLIWEWKLVWIWWLYEDMHQDQGDGSHVR